MVERRVRTEPSARDVRSRVLFLLFGVAIGVAHVLIVDPSTGTDIVMDKYQAIEAWTGDPFLTQQEIADRHGFVDVAWPAPAPRTPMALLQQTVLIPFPDVWLRWVAMVGAMATVALCCYGAGRIAGVDEKYAGVVFLVLFGLNPDLSIWFNLTNLSSALIVVGWMLLDRRPRLGGILLGAAAALKVWPVIVVVPLLLRRGTRESGWSAVLAGAGLTGMGLLIPNVGLPATIEAMGEANKFFREFSMNLSPITAFGPIVAVVGVLVLVWGLRGARDRMIGPAIVAGLVMSPIVWLNYWLAALPLLFLLGKRVASGFFSSPGVPARSPE